MPQQGRTPAQTNVLVIASLTLSVISLFVAISGAATAGKNGVKIPKNSITSKQVKDGTLTEADFGSDSVSSRVLAAGSVGSSEIGPGAVGSGAIAPGAVGSGALAPGAVGTGALAPGSVDTGALANGAVDGSKVKDATITHDLLARDSVDASNLQDNSVSLRKTVSPPDAIVSATTVHMTSTFGGVCAVNDPMPYTTVDRNISNVFSNSQPTRLTAPVAGTYRVTVNAAWDANANGNVRVLGMSRIIGSGIHAGESVFIQGASGVPVSGSPTRVSLTFDVHLDATDYLELQVASCGTTTDVPASSVNTRMVLTAQD